MTEPQPEVQSEESLPPAPPASESTFASHPWGLPQAPKDRLARARYHQWYEHRREELTELVQVRRLTHSAIAAHLGVSKSLVSFMCRVLEITSDVTKCEDIVRYTSFITQHGVTPAHRDMYQRNAERDLVRAMRRAYGVVGRGW